MEGIENVVDDPAFVRIGLEAGFYIVLNAGGMIVASTDPHGIQDEHAHTDWAAADQIARTIFAARERWR